MIKCIREKYFISSKVPMYVKSMKTNRIYGPLYCGDEIMIDESECYLQFYLESLFLHRILRETTFYVSKDKIIIGVSAYGMDWQPLRIRIL